MLALKISEREKSQRRENIIDRDFKQMSYSRDRRKRKRRTGRTGRKALEEGEDVDDVWKRAGNRFQLNVRQRATIQRPKLRLHVVILEENEAKDVRHGREMQTRFQHQIHSINGF